MQHWTSRARLRCYVFFMVSVKAPRISSCIGSSNFYVNDFSFSVMSSATCVHSFHVCAQSRMSNQMSSNSFSFSFTLSHSPFPSQARAHIHIHTLINHAHIHTHTQHHVSTYCSNGTAGLWIVIVVVSRYHEHCHRLSRLRGYLAFYRETQILRKAPFVASSAGIHMRISTCELRKIFIFNTAQIECHGILICVLQYLYKCIWFQYRANKLSVHVYARSHMQAAPSCWLQRWRGPRTRTSTT
jgi:hypothetical protein